MIYKHAISTIVPLHPVALYPISVLPSLSRLMKSGIGEGFTRADHQSVANQLFACYAKVQDVRALASVIGEEELSDSDKQMLSFGRAFDIIIFLNLDKIPSIFRLIFSEAFSLKKVGAGFMGYTITVGMRYGFARGIFSNEAGMGSAPMAHASSNSKNPIEQGLWGIFEVFVDTFLVCSITGIIAVMNLDLINRGLNGASFISEAFRISFPGNFGSIGLAIALFLFAFTTLIGWSHYGVVSLGYLTNS